MRIAVSGAHRTGKTTLVGELVDSLPAFVAIDEPNHLLAEEGHSFAEMPGVEGFEAQLERSIRSILESEGDCIFDRCPLDLLAYLIVHRESGRFDIDHWLPGLREGVQQLDLIVFVPIEDPEPIAGSDLDHPGLRRLVNDEIRDLVIDDQWGFGVPATEVTGSVRERAGQVLAFLGGDAASG